METASTYVVTDVDEKRGRGGEGGGVLAKGVYRDGRPEMIFTFTVDRANLIGARHGWEPQV